MNAVGSRRHALRALGAVAALPFISTKALARARPRVVVIGAGYGGATAARYLALWGGDDVDVTLVERDVAFVSCPLSNL
ncbi:MAG TPA: FAD-dependent oxidoreductase, partial [Casimicrobiaceae bacterium]